MTQNQKSHFNGYAADECARLWRTCWAADRANAVHHWIGVATLAEIEDFAALLVEQRWRTIARVAEALAARGDLSGAELDRLR